MIFHKCHPFNSVCDKNLVAKGGYFSERISVPENPSALKLNFYISRENSHQMQISLMSLEGDDTAINTVTFLYHLLGCRIHSHSLHTDTNWTKDSADPV